MVARETSSSAEIAQALKAAAIPAATQAISRLTQYRRLLRVRAIPLGLLGPAETDRILHRHLVESAALSRLLLPGDLVADVGSGAGLPGLVLACLGSTVVLIETLERRATFLQDVIAELGLDATVQQVRAEDAGRGVLRDSFDVVVCRALAALPVAMELCLPLVKVGGRWIVPATPEPAIEQALVRVADELGARAPRWEELLVPGAGRPRCVMIVDKFRSTPDRFPRRPGVPKKRPLG